jgi:hypothetical protein
MVLSAISQIVSAYAWPENISLSAADTTNHGKQGSSAANHENSLPFRVLALSY